MKYIVDLDGTLIRLQADWQQIKREIAKTLSRNNLEGVDRMDHNLERLRAQNLNAYNDLLETISVLECQNLALAPVNLKLLDRLKMMPSDSIAIFSANCRQTLIKAFNETELRAIKQPMMIGKQDVTMGKPSSEGILKILAEKGWSRSDVTMIGDTDNDEIPASSEGIRFEWVTW